MVLALCMEAAFDAAARPVSYERAMRGAEDWILHSKARHRLHFPSGDVRTVSLDGTNLVHLVALDGGGFVTVSADDSFPTIRGFSASGEIPAIDENSPLWALLVGRRAKHRSKPRMERRKVSPRFKSAKSGSSRKLLAGGEYPIAEDAGIEDIRVMPLVQSKWGQERDIYNYYVKRRVGEYKCGCTATSMAQLMRYHEYPKSSVATNMEFMCYVGTNTGERSLATVGGVYDWGKMPYDPSQASISGDEIEMIGRLCYDAGISLHMQYNIDGKGSSGAWGEFSSDPLTSLFGYANACSYICYDKSNNYDPVEISTEDIENSILANLDAGFPVLLGILGVENVGHSVVVDGYGYDVDGILYCHLNMGWNNLYDYWYPIPIVNTPDRGSYCFISSVVYNIFPESTGELVTGRVVDPFGFPATNAVVLAKVSCDGEETYTTNLTVSATGVYSLIVPSVVCTTTLSATVCDESWTAANDVVVHTEASISPCNFDYESGDYDDPGMSIGNSWGNDLVLVQTNVVAASEIRFSPATGESMIGDGFSLTFNGPSGAWYTVLRSELLPPDWTVYTNIQVSATGEGSVTLPMDSSTNSCFYCIAPRNMIQ